MTVTMYINGAELKYQTQPMSRRVAVFGMKQLCFSNPVQPFKVTYEHNLSNSTYCSVIFGQIMEARTTSMAKGGTG